jgi:hypothetical protein
VAVVVVLPLIVELFDALLCVEVLGVVAGVEALLLVEVLDPVSSELSSDSWYAFPFFSPDSSAFLVVPSSEFSDSFVVSFSDFFVVSFSDFSVVTFSDFFVVSFSDDSVFFVLAFSADSLFFEVSSSDCSELSFPFTFSLPSNSSTVSKLVKTSIDYLTWKTKTTVFSLLVSGWKTYIFDRVP